MTENEISKIIVDRCLHIHRSLGPGLLESVYETVLEFELMKLDFMVDRQKIMPLVWEGIAFDHCYRADLIVNGRVLIEVKSVAAVAPVHLKQVQTYLILSKIKLGLLINFNEELMKFGIHRVVNRL